MKEVVKQRLVGALILLALGVIFWPIIFVDPDTDIDMETLQMPPRPQLSSDFDSRTEGMANSLDALGAEPLPEPETLPEADSTLETVESMGGESVEEGAAAARGTGTPADSVQDEIQIPVSGETRDAPFAEPQLDAQGLPVVWTLQLVTLSDGIKAEALRQDLLADGHKAYVRSVSVDGKSLYRVHIGPKAERAQLEALQAELDQRLGVKSMIRRYLP